MDKNLTARATIAIDAPADKVWQALVNPEAIKEYMFGTNVVSDWREGSAISWRGEFQGKKYEDKGILLRVAPREKLQYSHFSPLSGRPDEPENYHTVTIELSGHNGRTDVSLEQDKNPNEEARSDSEKNWATMLAGLKKYLEHPRA